MKSPLKSRPLNNPGESLEARLYDVAVDKVFVPILITIFLVIAALIEWLRWYFDAPPNPYLFTFIAVIALIVFTVRIRKTFKSIRSIKLGIAGEKAVGQYLERLRSQGAEVFHDIQGENFNLDHVVIHRTGVYVVETKTKSKPAKGKSELHFDGLQILQSGFPLLKNPVVQVSAASSWLAELLKESTGRKVEVRGVVTFPGWYIHSSSNSSNAKVWVLNPKAIPSFISAQSEVFSNEDVHMLKFHLGKYIRSNIPG